MVLRVRAITQFNRKVIKNNWQRMNKRPITRAGMLVRKIARQSIKSRKGNKPSPAGSPPRSRSSRREYKLIFSVPNYFATNAMVGPVGFGKEGGKTTPELHEFGGRATRRVFTKHGVKQGRKGRRDKRGKFLKDAKERRVSVRASVQYPERATMGPALKVAKPLLPALWKDALK